MCLQAYILGQIDPDYKDIVHSISSIIFLSTPHRGTGLAKTLNRILSVGGLPRNYVTDLERNSLALQKINDQFRHFAPKLNIASFYETRETAIGPKKIVLDQYDLWSLLLMIFVANTRTRFLRTRISWGGFQISGRRPPRGLQVRKQARSELHSCAELGRFVREKNSH